MPEANAQQPGECPDLGLIAAYVDGRLAESERDALHRHLAACDICTELVAETVAANEAALGPAAAPPECPNSRRRDRPSCFSGVIGWSWRARCSALRLRSRWPSE
jgi:anti-sigma factor RsiW